MKNKLKEFWMRFDRDGNHDIGSAFISLERCKDLSEEYWDKEILHVKTVSPEYDAVVLELVKAMQDTLKCCLVDDSVDSEETECAKGLKAALFEYHKIVGEGK